MKRSLMLLSVLVLCLSSSLAYGQRKLTGFFEIQTTTPDLKSNLILDGGLNYQVTAEWGAKAFFLEKGGWAQAYIGPTWTPVPYLTLSAGAGVSQNQKLFELRTAYSASFLYQGVGLSAAVEMNNPAYQGDDKSIWYDLNLTYQPLRWLIVGLKDRRPVGFGPQVRFKYDVLELWAAWAPLDAERAQYDLARFILALKSNL